MKPHLMLIVLLLGTLCGAQSEGLDEHTPAEAPTISVDVRLLLQFRYTVSVAPDAPDPDDDPSVGFSYRRLRPKVVFKTSDGSLKGVFQGEGQDNTGIRLWDAFFDYRIDDRLLLRFGQFAPAFDRESMVSTSRQLVVDRSSASNTLNPNATDRVQGFEFRYDLGPKDLVYLTVSEGMSQFGSAFDDPAAEWGITSRFERLLIGDSFKQFRQFTAPRDTPRALLLGVAGHMQGTQNAGDRVAWTADLTFQDSGFNALLKTSGHIAEDRNIGAIGEPESAYGVLGQAGFYATEIIEPFVRYEWATTSDQAHPDLSALTVGFNWYIMGHALKVVTDFTVAFDGIGPAFDRSRDGLLQTPAGADRYVFRTQIQLLF